MEIIYPQPKNIDVCSACQSTIAHKSEQYCSVPAFPITTVSQQAVESVHAHNSFACNQHERQVSVNRELSRLRTIFNLYITWKKYEGENPVRRFKLAPESRGRARFLSEAEELVLWKVANEPLRSAIIIQIHTELRMQSEGMSLTWPNVDIDAETVTVEDHFAKNGETRTIPLNSIALKTFKKLNASTPGPWVFMTRGRRKEGFWKQYRSFRTAFETACRPIGYMTPGF